MRSRYLSTGWRNKSPTFNRHPLPGKAALIRLARALRNHCGNDGGKFSTKILDSQEAIAGADRCTAAAVGRSGSVIHAAIRARSFAGA